jgi:hypothetical protein
LGRRRSNFDPPPLRPPPMVTWRLRLAPRAASGCCGTARRGSAARRPKTAPRRPYGPPRGRPRWPWPPCPASHGSGRAAPRAAAAPDVGASASYCTRCAMAWPPNAVRRSQHAARQQAEHRGDVDVSSLHRGSRWLREVETLHLRSDRHLAVELSLWRRMADTDYSRSNTPSGLTRPSCLKPMS